MRDFEENIQIGEQVALPALAEYLGCNLEEVDFGACDAQDDDYLGFTSSHKQTGKSYYVKVVLDTNEVTVEPIPDK